MEYKGYNISEVGAVILLDILETQKEILSELKKLNEQHEVTQNEVVETNDKAEFAPIVEVHKADTEGKQNIPITTKEVKTKSAKKPTKKKTKSKKV